MENVKITIEREGHETEIYEVDDSKLIDIKNAIVGVHTTETLKSIVDTFGTMNKKPILYDMSEFPSELKIADQKLTISDIIAIYKETGFILVDGKGKLSSNTKIGAW